MPSGGETESDSQCIGLQHVNNTLQLTPIPRYETVCGVTKPVDHKLYYNIMYYTL